MTTSKIITIIDRVALGVMNVLALVGLPLVAVGMVAQSF